MQGLTRKELAFVDAFRDYYDEHGVSPAYSDLIDLGVAKSKSSISKLVNQLEAKNIIRRHRYSARGIILIEDEVCPTCGQRRVCEAPTAKQPH